MCLLILDLRGKKRLYLKDAELLKLFKRACQKHDKLMNEARENAGCDRHLLGLKLLSRELGIELHDLYKDPSWKKRFIVKCFVFNTIKN
jgi:hypothetical protein